MTLNTIHHIAVMLGLLPEEKKKAYKEELAEGLR